MHGEEQNRPGTAGAVAGEEWAAALAPHLDRLALCVHGPASRRPELRGVLGLLGLPPLSFAVSAARLVASGRITVDDLALLGRYQPRRWPETSMKQHLERGLVRPSSDGASFVPREDFQAAAVRVLELQAEEAARIWSPQSCSLDRVLTSARALVESATASPEALPAFRQQTGTHHVVPEGAAGQLLGCLTELRYLRSDVHAAAWEGADLSGPAVQVLHRVWRGFGAGDVSLGLIRYLEERGLLGSRGGDWGPTDQGTATCEAVEIATDINFAELFMELSDPQRNGLLESLSALDGDDPRPAEDR